MTTSSPTTPGKHRKPALSSLPADDVKQFRSALTKFLNTVDDQGRKIGNAKWGVYAFYDYEGEPIYVGQTKEKLGYRVRRHLTNQRTDAVAMRVLDPIEVAYVELWPLWHLQEVSAKNPDAKEFLNSSELTAYLEAIKRSKFKAVLNEKIPLAPRLIDLPKSWKQRLISDLHILERGHDDIRIARRAETLSRLAAVARERGEVSAGLRRVIVIQAIRLAYLGAQRLALAEGRPEPDPASIDMASLIGSVLKESDAEKPEDYDEDDDED